MAEKQAKTLFQSDVYTLLTITDMNNSSSSSIHSHNSSNITIHRRPSWVTGHLHHHARRSECRAEAQQFSKVLRREWRYSLIASSRHPMCVVWCDRERFGWISPMLWNFTTATVVIPERPARKYDCECCDPVRHHTPWDLALHHHRWNQAVGMWFAAHERWSIRHRVPRDAVLGRCQDSRRVRVIARLLRFCVGEAFQPCEFYIFGFFSKFFR